MIDLGIANKGRNCEEVGANHKWFNFNRKEKGCYYCKVITDKSENDFVEVTKTKELEQAITSGQAHKVFKGNKFKNFD
ncbi:hypothetical protein SAMN04489761_2785 [Tenacibaculum sp. MAR_2009_124]|uniref:hypothetical protein n=1 Tax=Tenacibaculum sp. MAR_2009_124 TaxID=1250059 RepID=UPI000898E6C3|nr:hypothetical protein [Tenacibaculum sp. MAR_2009_124]SEC36393.1 hypothetical protein SAMN04489761_2785 [Tenacibaculum sp. MAR_2009_124]